MIAKLIILAIRAYQVVLSPVFGRCCRFHPTCSHYCLDAIRLHGPWKGLWLGLRRICRCHPFNPGGWDPVPGPLTEDCMCHE